MNLLEIIIDDIKLEVEYDFDEGSDGDYSFAPYSDQIEIESVKLVGSKVEIKDILAKYVFSLINEKIYHYEVLAK
jgi:hypothetical protein